MFVVYCVFLFVAMKKFELFFFSLTIRLAFGRMGMMWFINKINQWIYLIFFQDFDQNRMKYFNFGISNNPKFKLLCNFHWDWPIFWFFLMFCNQFAFYIRKAINFVNNKIDIRIWLNDWIATPHKMIAYCDLQFLSHIFHSLLRFRFRQFKKN